MFGVDPDPVYDHFSAFVNITQILLFYGVFGLDRGRYSASLQLCSRCLRDNAGIGGVSAF